jgi:hypothetical protein
MRVTAQQQHQGSGPQGSAHARERMANLSGLERHFFGELQVGVTHELNLNRLPRLGKRRCGLGGRGWEEGWIDGMHLLGEPEEWLLKVVVRLCGDFVVPV